MAKKYQTRYYYGRRAQKDARFDLRTARGFGKMASLQKTGKGYVLRWGKK